MVFLLGVGFGGGVGCTGCIDEAGLLDAGWTPVVTGGGFAAGIGSST